MGAPTVAAAAEGSGVAARLPSRGAGPTPGLRGAGGSDGLGCPGGDPAAPGGTQWLSTLRGGSLPWWPQCGVLKPSLRVCPVGLASGVG